MPGHALDEHVSAAQQPDEQAGDGGVLADDGLADLGPQARQPRARVVVVVFGHAGTPFGSSTAASSASRSCARRSSPASSCGTGPARTVWISPAGRCRRPARAAVTCSALDPRGSVSRVIRRRQGGGPQRPCRAVAGGGALVEPAVALDEFDGAHLDRQRLAHHAAEPPGPPEHDEDADEQQPHEAAVDPAGEQVPDAGGTRTPGVGAGQDPHHRGRRAVGTEQVDVQRGHPAVGEVVVAQQVARADERHRAAPDDRAAVAGDASARARVVDGRVGR